MPAAPTDGPLRRQDAVTRTYAAATMERGQLAPPGGGRT
jgi:hypothetical protein